MRSKYPPKVEKDSHAVGTEDEETRTRLLQLVPIMGTISDLLCSVCNRNGSKAKADPKVYSKDTI